MAHEKPILPEHLLRPADRVPVAVPAQGLPAQEHRLGESEKGFLSKSGVKELQAYMQEYNLKQGVLAVPGQTPDEWDHEDVTGQNFRIRAIAVPTATFVDSANVAAALLNEMWN